MNAAMGQHLPVETFQLHALAETLLTNAEATPTGSWRISAEDHAAFVSLAEAAGVELQLSAFRSAEGAAAFLRLVLQALRD